MKDGRQIETEYDRYTKLCEFTGKPVPMFEEYILQKGYKLEDYLTGEDLENAKRNQLRKRSQG